MKFHEFGDKENQHIMLIHGGGNSWWNYLRQAKALSKEYHVILPTLDGHGEEYNTEYVSTTDSAQKLILYINRNCNGQLFLLCGVSLGGQIVIEMLSLKADICQKAIIDGILTLPMVLPPTVAGFFLLLIFSRRRPFGIFLFENFGIKVVQTWLGCIIAATVISFPLMYRNARAAMEQIDVNLIYAGRTLGMSDTEIFWKVVIPTAGPGIASGTILTFARALGEYGATSMLAGNIPGKTGTISQKIAMVIQDGDYMTAGVWVAIVLVIAFLVIFLMNLISGKKMKNVKRW